MDDAARAVIEADAPIDPNELATVMALPNKLLGKSLLTLIVDGRYKMVTAIVQVRFLLG